MNRSKLNLVIQTHPTTNEVSAEVGVEVRRSAASLFWRAWMWWLPPAFMALALVLYFIDPFIGDWDGMDYTMLSLAGYPSSMALGRNLFIFGNHALFVVAHALFRVQPENAYLIFKYAVVIQAPLAAVACWVLAQNLTRSAYTATVAALLLVFSPVFVLYGGQVMTDVPSVLLLATALIIHFRGVERRNIWMILVGAGLLGLGVNLRETIGFYAPWLVLAAAHPEYPKSDSANRCHAPRKCEGRFCRSQPAGTPRQDRPPGGRRPDYGKHGQRGGPCSACRRRGSCGCCGAGS